MTFTTVRTAGASLILGALVLSTVWSASPPTNDPFSPSQREYWAFQKVTRPTSRPRLRRLIIRSTLSSPRSWLRKT